MYALVAVFCTVGLQNGFFGGEALSLSGRKAENRIKAVSGQESGCFNTGRG
ncbi:hypothetical protein [Prevotella heparinolytica]|uniref:hypothetical protein n=1 Tax=Prevotella heparinolytica TaxID=28113 RepID=UPI0013EA6118|nr:hypothetical protein [Bacteroides heparinolyticus]